MNSVLAKSALVPLVLTATWATAQADATLTTTVTPTAAMGTVDHVRIFSEDYTPSGSPLLGSPGAYIPGSATLSSDFGSIVPASSATGSTTVSYAAGTSAFAGFVGTIGTDSILLTSSTSIPTAAASYLSTGTNFSDVFASIVSGNVSPLASLYANQDYSSSGNNGLQLANFDPGSASTQTLSGYILTRASNGTVTSSTQFASVGTLTIAPITNPTPEPASMAALGVGAVALIRRRRKLA